MKKLFIITAVFLFILSGFTQKTETAKEEEPPVITEKDIIKTAFDQLPVNGYDFRDYNSLYSYLNPEYLTGQAAKLFSKTLYEYERRNNAELTDVEPEKLIELDKLYFGIDEEL